METNILNTAYNQLLKQSVNVCDKEHQAISQNIANTNNDSYRRINTDFSAELKTAMENSRVKTTRDKHIQQGHFQNSPSGSAEPNPEERVDLAREMTDLTVNQIRHEFVTRALSRQYSGISQAIVGRNR